MSFIPNKAMPHAQADAGRFDPETGKLTPVDQGDTSGKAVVEAPAASSHLGWLLGAAGAGVALAAAAALFSLRSSSASKPVRRRKARSTATATPRRRRSPAKTKKAA